MKSIPRANLSGDPIPDNLRKYLITIIYTLVLEIFNNKKR
jgi:hypothetical protein